MENTPLYQKSQHTYPYGFLALYAATYACNAVYNTFIPVYLNHLGFTRSIIGIMLALGPFVALFAQPVWGIAGDRAKTKNSVLMFLIAGSALTAVIYPVNHSFIYLLSAIVVFTFFQTAINPISDAITLEHLESTRWKFGPIRMAGTVGFALMSIITGLLTRQNINNIFILYFFMACFALSAAYRLPKVKGHQSESGRVSIFMLFKNTELVLLLLFNFIVMVTLGFYYSFFSIYYRQLGADNYLLGWAMFITASCEIPFLLFSSRILGRFGIKRMLLVSASIMGARWLLLHSVTNIYAILAINSLHGLSFIVFAFSLATFINSSVQKELRASGQTLNGLIGIGLARIVGSILGGYFCDIYGIKQVFLYTSLINFATVAVFGFIFLLRLKLSKRNKALKLSA